MTYFEDMQGDEVEFEDVIAMMDEARGILEEVFMIFDAAEGLVNEDAYLTAINAIDSFKATEVRYREHELPKEIELRDLKASLEVTS